MLTSAMIIRFMRDYKDFNLLLDEEQFTSDDLDQAISMAISEYNAITPVTTFIVTSFPNDYILLIGTAVYLLTSEMFLLLRNAASYRDGDVSVRNGDNVNDYRAMKNDLKKEWKLAARNMKTQQNMEQCYGGLRSGYSYVKNG